MKVSLIQMESNGTREENEEKAIKLINEAISDKTDIICLSELFLYWGEDYTKGYCNVEAIEKYQKIAKKNNVNIILGSVALKDTKTNKTTNTCFVLNRKGEIVCRYDKTGDVVKPKIKTIFWIVFALLIVGAICLTVLACLHII